MEGVLDAAVISDDTGRICFVNSEAERLFGWLRADLIGKTIEVLVPEIQRAGHVALRQGQIHSPHFRPMDKRVVPARRRDGSQFDLQVSIGRATIDGQILVISIARDVTAAHRREREAWDQIKRLQVLNLVNQAGARCEDLQGLATAVMFELDANELTQYAAMGVVTDDRANVRLLARSRILPGETDAHFHRLPGRTSRDVWQMAALGADAVLAGQEVAVPDMQNSTLPGLQGLATLGLRSCVFVPCGRPDHVQAVICFARKEPGPFPAVDREFFRALSYQFWVAADHIRLAEAQRRVDAAAAHDRQSSAHRERLAVLGSMAAGVVHDIHNAITPVLCLAELELGHGGEGLFAAQLAKPPSLDTLQQALDAAILALDLPAHAPVALEP